MKALNKIYLSQLNHSGVIHLIRLKNTLLFFVILFNSAGYHKTCLLKSICELARHPLHNESNEEHLIMDIINFLLK